MIAAGDLQAWHASYRQVTRARLIHVGAVSFRRSAE
jgi:hypothetical protein